MAEEEEKVAAEVQPKVRTKAKPKTEPKVKWAPVRAKARPKEVEPEVEKLDGQFGRIQAQLLFLERTFQNPW